MTDFFLLVGKISPAKSLEIITQFNQTKLSTQHQKLQPPAVLPSK